jgi:hypothetical protein
MRNVIVLKPTLESEDEQLSRNANHGSKEEELTVESHPL